MTGNGIGGELGSAGLGCAGLGQGIGGELGSAGLGSAGLGSAGLGSAGPGKGIGGELGSASVGPGGLGSAGVGPGGLGSAGVGSAGVGSAGVGSAGALSRLRAWTRRAVSRLGRVVEQWGLPAISRTGLAATILIAVGSFGAGALPANDPTRRIPGLALLRHGWLGLHVALSFYYGGLILLVITWLVLGRLLLTGSSRGTRAVGREVVEPRVLRIMFTRWMLPLLVGMPLASMDLYSYAAQAQLAQNGFNPYTATPADLPGKFLDNVAWKWVDTPSPYGPAWVVVSRLSADITGNHALIGALLLRLLPFGAIVATAVLLPSLARRFGGRADLALWLAIANPLVLVHGVGGGHNDAVMVALVVAAIAVALRAGAGWRHLVAAAVLATLAAAIKAPGLVAVAFLVPIHLLARPPVTRRTWLAVAAVTAAAATAAFTAISLIAGVGLGWTKQVTSNVPVINFMSLPTMAAVGYRAVLGVPHAGTVVDQTVRNFRSVGSGISAVLLLVIWLRGCRREPVRFLALGLFTLVVLSPAVQPWYFTWTLTIASLFVVSARRVSWIAAASVALTLLTRPMGSGLELAPYVPSVALAALASRALLGPVVHRHTKGMRELSGQPVGRSPTRTAPGPPAEPHPTGQGQQDQDEPEPEVLDRCIGNPNAEDGARVVSDDAETGEHAICKQLKQHHDQPTRPERSATEQAGAQ